MKVVDVVCSTTREVLQNWFLHRHNAKNFIQNILTEYIGNRSGWFPLHVTIKYNPSIGFFCWLVNGTLA